MAKRTYALTNSGAAELSQEELFRRLYDIFAKETGKAPSVEEEHGLREAAEWIKDNSAKWRDFERGLTDGTWDPAEGARAVLSQGD